MSRHRWLNDWVGCERPRPRKADANTRACNWVCLVAILFTIAQLIRWALTYGGI